MPGNSSELQFNRPLTEVARDYVNTEYIGDQVITEVPVDDETFSYEEFSASRAFVPVNDAADQNGDVPQTISTSSTTQGATVSRALREPVNALVEHAGQRIGYSPKMRAMKNVLNTQDLNNEQRVVAFLQDDTNFVASRIDAAPAIKWDQYATATPLADITAMKDLLIVPPGSEVIGVCSRSVWSNISLCEKVLDAVKYTMIGGLAEVAPIAARLGLADIKIGGAWKYDGPLNDTEANLAAGLARLWGEEFYLIVRPSAGSTADRGQPAFAYNFRLRLNGATKRVYEYQTPQRGGDGSWWVQVARNDVLKSVGKLYAAKIKDTLT